MKCDIIIAVYNAYDALVECVNSVIKNTNLKENNLIIINDKSTDKKITPYLEELPKINKDLNIQIIENEENLGFIKTVNRGMKLSQNDVLLLNSDTEVTKNWLDNIKKCAYSNKKIATVTPLSNNATLVSVPNAFIKNELPNDLTLDEYNEIISKCSYNDLIELPTAHGFCMYIKREVLNLVGYFDESFGKGYGEENDFCFRCLNYGYRHVLCDNVLVLHKESQSFSTERKKLVELHNKILKERYPLYVSNLEEWCMQNPIQYIGKNIFYNTELKNKQNVLIIVHDFLSEVGGTTLHVKDIINTLKDKFNFHILSYNDGAYKLFSYFENNETVTVLDSISKSSILPRYNEQYKKMLEKIIEAFGIKVVHIHHMLNHYFDIISLKEKYKLKLILTLHDFYAICPTINLLYENRIYCGDLETKDCKNCLKKALNLDNDIIKDWQSDFNDLFKSCDTIIVPSNDTKEKINAIYKDIPLTVIEHGVDILKTDYTPSINDSKLNVAYVGALSITKGLDIFENLIKNTKNKNITYHLFGISAFDRLHRNRRNFINHGQYKRDEIAKLLKENNIDLVCFFQIWPETYSYTVSEVVSSNIPILTYDLGAGANRVKTFDFGWNIPVNSNYQEIEKVLLDILNDKDGYNKKVKNIKEYKLKTVREMAYEYENLYKDTIINVSYQKIASLLKEYSGDSNLIKSKLELILNSTRWKLVNKISFSPDTTNLIRKVISIVKK